MVRRVLSNLIALVLILNISGYCDAQEKLEYRISVNDLLEISVYEELDLTKTVRVAADGTISYPLLGNILAKGLTAKELEAKITEMLAEDYLVKPQVSVFIKEYAKISVLGQIRNPGSYELKAGLTVIGAIALAGGFAERADVEIVKLVRTKDSEKQTINLNADEIIKSGSKEGDLPLEPGDLIIIGEITVGAVFVFVLGEVRGPGRYNFKKGMTVIEAIALAGGFTDRAATNKVRVIRAEDDRKKRITVPVGSILQEGDKSRDITLEPNDTVVVPESFF